MAASMALIIVALAPIIPAFQLALSSSRGFFLVAIFTLPQEPGSMPLARYTRSHSRDDVSMEQPNAGGEPRAMAGATQERRLLCIGSTAWFGGVWLPLPHPRPPLMRLHRRSSTPQRTPARVYLITSSAWKRSVGGIVSPRALVVLRLRTSSNFIGCSTGRSAGLAPLRILSTYTAARCCMSRMLGP